MNIPQITVITVCYNASDIICQTISSIAEQTWSNVEFILVDGGSTDDTLQKALAFSHILSDKKFTFRYVSEKDQGIYDAMNKGIRMANGTWINFMNAGDSFTSSQVFKQVFSQNIPPDTTVIYGNACLLMEFGIVRMKPKPIEFLAKKMPFCHQAAFVRTSEMKLHPFDLHYRITADYDFFYRCYLRGAKFTYCNIDVANFEAEKGISSLNRLTANKEYARIHGVDRKISWKLWFALKYVRTHLKDILQHLLPAKQVSKIRKQNYKRIQKRRLSHE